MRRRLDETPEKCYKCPLCGRVCGGEQSFRQHVISGHPHEDQLKIAMHPQKYEVPWEPVPLNAPEPFQNLRLGDKYV